METKHIMLIVLLVIGGGVFLSGFMIKIITNKRNESCSQKVVGKVVQHKFQGDGRMFPLVEFEVDGRTYLTKKKFNAIKSLNVKGSPILMEADAYEDEKGNLCVKTGPIANYHNLAEKLWPIGKEMTVFYNPQNPEINYVERPIRNSFLTIFLGIFGAFIILLEFVLFFLISK